MSTAWNTHTHPFNGPLSGTTQVSRYQKGKTNLDFTEARDSEWQWDQLDHMQVSISLQTDNHASTHHSVFLQAACPSCRPTNSVKALKARLQHGNSVENTVEENSSAFSLISMCLLQQRNAVSKMLLLQLRVIANTGWPV